MNTARKVTVELPGQLLRKAEESTSQGAAATVAASQTYEELLRLKGKINFSVGWRELRVDRS